MESLEEAVRIALSWELEARDNYLRWSKEANEPNVKRLFFNLHRMEEWHVRLLEGLDFKGDAKVSSGTVWLDLSHGMTSYPTSSDRRLRGVFEYAISKEEASNSRYQRMAEALPAGKTRDFFLALASEEKYHRTLLIEQYTRLLRPY